MPGRLPRGCIFNRKPVRLTYGVSLCTLLRQTNLPIGEIGQRCGYETETCLKALFKARFGMTMRAYRKMPTPPAERA